VNIVAASVAQLNYRAIAATQWSCLATRAARDSSSTLHPITFDSVELLCDTSHPQPRPLIPAAHRRQVFTTFHSLGHQGTQQSDRGMGDVALHGRGT
jgi:hypothetical protein